MYTAQIFLLVIISAYLLMKRWEEYRRIDFWFYFCFTCLFGWTEFYHFLKYDAWVFDPKQITGTTICGVTIEDLIFCPCFAIIFSRIYFWLKPIFKQRSHNPWDKMGFVLALLAIGVFFYDMGSPFSKYMAFRLGIGLVAYAFTWNMSSFRHCGIFLLIVYVIGFGWDLPAVNLEWWVYVKDGVIPPIYKGDIITIFRGQFPVELFVYYLSGGLFAFGIRAFMDWYRNYSHKKSYDGITDTEWLMDKKWRR